MPEYIEREAAKKILSFGVGVSAALALDKVPAADVVSKAVLEQVMWERDMAMEQLQEHGIPFGGKADVVAVVRCKECKKKGKKKCPLILIQFGRNGKEVLVQNVVPDDFSCSYGERRGEDENA